MMSTVPLFLTACDQPPSEVGVFRSVEECAASGEFTESDCRLQIAELQEQHAKEAPKFATREECVATYGPDACQETQTSSSSSSSSSRSSSFSSSSSSRPSTTTGSASPATTPNVDATHGASTIAGTGLTTGIVGDAVADAATTHTGGGSSWMPMLAGYMMGRMGGFNQPVYGQPGASMFRTRTGETVGPGVQTLPPSKASAISATGRTSAAVSRGGFGSRMSSSAAG